MKVLKTCLVITLAVFFSLACSSPESENKSAANANTAMTPSSNTSAGQPVAVIPSNSNSGAAAEPSTASKATDGRPASKVDAAALYVSQKCVGCHGPDGKGKVKGAQNFTDAAWQKKETDAELIEAIKKGKVPKMPAFASKLKEDEIKALVAYIRTFAGK